MTSSLHRDRRRKVTAPQANPPEAPRARAALAGLIDAGVMVVPTAVVWRRTMRAGAAGGSYRPPRWTSALAPAFAVMGEQLGTPGDWIMGVRTVDKRTGARIALWRTLTVALVRIAGRRLAGQLSPPPVILTDMEQRQQRSEIEAIKERHRDDEDALNAELMRHYSEHRVNPRAGLWRVFAAGLGSVLVNRVVRRRLAPTVVIDARDHRP
jgi:hypothetical protein